MSRIPSFSPVLAAIATAAVAAGCASSGSAPKPFPVPGRGAPRVPGSPPSARVPAGIATGVPGAGTTATWYSLVSTALQYRGVPYVNGGATPSGFDCSGFTQYVFAQHGLALPREVRDQFRVGEEIEDDELVLPGDLVFFNTEGRGASHVALMLEGDEFVHAPSSNGVVRIEKLSSDYWARRYLGARRIIESDD